MENMLLFISLWVFGWILCSIIYMVSDFNKAKYLNENWSFLKSIKFTPNLIVIWPFTLAAYIWFNIRLKLDNSIELPEGLEAVELSKESSQIE
ncbi:MAG: hypothetical protein QNJ46_05610 [Leptolyngbyaceae cyanobacterium MO_188.B28]|nr:hypothetical protein [Leptolyngbyaceae cyanobacterium MO_188.B28]